MNELAMQILLGLCLAGAITGLLLYANRFSAGLWPWPSAPQDTARPEELPRLPYAPYEPDRRRDTRTRHIVEWVEDEMNESWITSAHALGLLDAMGVPKHVSTRIVAGRK